ncbi:MAG: hypothetical protein IKM46_00730 [Clostridia bacterium]|nr:hypothetical protein [Clostridia bacterium]
MKIKLIGLLLALTIISQTILIAPVTGIGGDNAEQSEDTPVAQAEDEAYAEEEETEVVYPGLEWMGYEDFTEAQIVASWANPSAFIGAKAAFNTESYSNIWCTNGPDAEDENYSEAFPDIEIILNEFDESITVQIVDYYTNEGVYYSDISNATWYKIAALEGETLPEILEEHPYVLHMAWEDDTPSLLIEPPKAVFADSVVTVCENTVATSYFVELDAADFPDFIVITEENYIVDEFGGKWYDLGESNAYTDPDTGKVYRYVSESSLILIPTEVTLAYEELLTAEGSYEYYEMLEDVPPEIRAKFSHKHLSELNEFVDELVRLENIEKSTTVTYNGVPVNVSVKGKIPETGVTLTVGVVSADTVMAEGFDIRESAEIITALDIKIINDIDGTEWQPEENFPVEVSIGMAELGYEDGKVFRFHHKHGDKIDVKDIFVVMDGKLTAVIGGFSIMVVSNVGSTTAVSNAETYNNGATINLAVGDEKIYYCNLNGTDGTWRVTDTSGAIHYNVYSNDTNSANIGHNQVRACWIKIVALKTTTERITLVYDTGSNTQTYYINIATPKAESGEKRLYIKDDVNSSGRIVAALVDENGVEVANGLDGAAFAWTRDDGLFIVPAAYDADYKGVNIARDHGGLVEARTKKDSNGNVIGYQPTTYTVKVILADGTELEDSYTVYYQSEIINAGFEFPNALTSSYSFFPNGYPELYWKTTAPGSGSNNITKDIEYGDVTNGTANTNDGTDFGVTHAADHAEGGVQFAELNAEAFGSLYQDIITAPAEDIVWKFAHAPRRQQSWATDITNRMFIVIGATEDAQKLTSQDQLQELGALAKEAGVTSDGNHVVVTYNGASYYVWYHDASEVGQNQGGGTNGIYSANNNYGWTELSGDYLVPDGQYRTRIFFVSDPPSGNRSPNAGNLIDISKAGQYKYCLVEYYEETFVDGKPVLTRIEEKQEAFDAIIYSSVKLENFNHFTESEHDYLHMVLINGSNYPYDVRYAGYASLYVENYPGEAEDLLEKGKNYDDYEIVMQIVFRDTVVAVQKELVFPDSLTEEQKLNIMQDMVDSADKGYKADFELCSGDAEYNFRETGSALVTNRDPMGNYKAFVSIGDNPEIGHTYIIEETDTTQIPGLKLSEVTFKVQLYARGQAIGSIMPTTYTETHIVGDAPLITAPFTLEGDTKIADVTVENKYVEKETTIVYHAIGNGKIKSNSVGSVFEDAPTETLKYYSGKSVGCSAHIGVGATFVGWYKDAACTQEVTAADGVYDKTTGSFKPNANILNAETVHFYAKFDTCNVVIERINGEPGKTFVYEVTGPNKENNDIITTYVTVTCDENGNGSTTIYEATKGQYTVKELDSWSWRYTGEEQTASHEASLSVTFTFDSASNSDAWLDGFSEPEKNVYGKG